jgi:hypothetical protein
LPESDKAPDWTVAELSNFIPGALLESLCSNDAAGASRSSAKPAFSLLPFNPGAGSTPASYSASWILPTNSNVKTAAAVCGDS